MKPIDRILIEAQRNLSCPVCGRRYEISEIKVRGVFDSTYVLQTVCQENHNPISTTFIAAVGNAVFKEITELPISRIETVRFNKALEQFDGDFKAQFTKKK